MVVLLDLDEDVLDPHADGQHRGGFADFRTHLQIRRMKDPEAVEAPERENPNINGFSAALGCYPYAAPAHLVQLPERDVDPGPCAIASHLK